MATYAAYRHVELDNIGYGKKRVLKPPGGGSSDIFGSAPEEATPRRVKNLNQSQLGSALYGDGPNIAGNNGNNGNTGANNSGAATPRSNSNSKPGNDTYNRLFGPPDAPPTTPNAKNHMRSNIALSGDSTVVAESPAKSTISAISTSSLVNGYTNDNNSNANDITGGSSCMPRNPVTGDGVDVTPLRRSARKCRDGNPVTGTGYVAEPRNNGPAAMQNGTSSSSNTSSIGEKSNDSSPLAKTPARNRVPPGGYSSGLW